MLIISNHMLELDNIIVKGGKINKVRHCEES